ncbi:DUF6879 family protein [Kitasatospora aureofaciens]|uniref:DUF6879 family protein n=1 Tax=Kitasatospora aureofaciens TaxID=1894 RepID=UPI001C45F9BF|nr:DUF6879 family protein [Kitasatospora aureofaciens]MBV6700376.1 hypothetical protein [Kitasatospora aureofaciens]
MQSVTDFSELLKSAQRSAVHLEMKDSYAIADEAPQIEAWRNGFRHNPDDRASWWRPWLDLTSNVIARGVVMRRARIVSEPVSEYIKYEYSGTFTNIAAGEQVRWLARHNASDLTLPGNDFWLIDGKLAIFNHFTGSGDWRDPDQTMTTDPAVVKLCTDAFEAVWDRAIDHEKYTV